MVLFDYFKRKFSSDDGHFVCSTCNASIKNQDFGVKCGECNKKQNADKTVDESVNANTTDSDEEQSEFFTEQLKASLLPIDDEVKNLNEKIENQYEYMNEALEVHVEFTKCKLDYIKDSFKRKFSISKEEMKKTAESRIDKKTFENEISETLKINRLTTNEKCKEPFKHLNEELAKLKLSDTKVNFKSSGFADADDNDLSFGTLNCSNKLEYPMANNVSKSYLYKSMKLSNSNYVILARDATIHLYDSNLKFIKTVHDDSINAYNITCGENVIYSTDRYNKWLLMYDNEFNLKKTVDNSQCWQYNYFNDLFYHENCLYVCTSCQSIDVYNSDLTVATRMYFKINPLKIRILKDLVLMQTNFDEICFYKLSRNAHYIIGTTQFSFLAGYRTKSKVHRCMSKEGVFYVSFGKRTFGFDKNGEVFSKDSKLFKPNDKDVDHLGYIRLDA